MKVWLFILFIFALIILGFVLGFLQGFSAGYLAKEIEGMETCGFFYDPISGNYIKDITKINLTDFNISNDTR